MKALVGAFNQEKALVGAFSVIVQPVMEPMDRFTALVFTRQRKRGGRAWCHVSLGRLSWLSVTGLLFVLILGPGPLHTVQCSVSGQETG